MKKIALHVTLDSPEDLKNIKGFAKPLALGEEESKYNLLLPQDKTPNECDLLLKSGFEISPLEFYTQFILGGKSLGIANISGAPTYVNDNESVESAELANNLVKLPLLFAELHKEKVALNQIVKQMNDAAPKEKGGSWKSWTALSANKEVIEERYYALKKKTDELQNILIPPVVAAEPPKTLFSRMLNAFAFKKQVQNDLPIQEQKETIPSVDSEHVSELKGVVGGRERIESIVPDSAVNLAPSVEVPIPIVETPIKPAAHIEELKGAVSRSQEASKAIPAQKKMPGGQDFREKMNLHVGRHERLEVLAKDPQYHNSFILQDDTFFTDKKIKILAFISAEGQFIESNVAKAVKINLLNNKIKELAEAQNKSGGSYTLLVEKKDLDIIRGCATKPEVFFSSQSAQKFKSQIPKEESKGSEEEYGHKPG